MLFLMPLLSKEENIKKHIRKFSGRFLRKKKKIQVEVKKCRTRQNKARQKTCTPLLIFR